jgi:hypothetical protein
MEHLHDQDMEQVEYFNSVPQEEKPVETFEQEIDYTKVVHCVVSWKPRSYKEVIKKFNNEKHFENWYDFITGRGGSVIGVSQPNEDDARNLKTKK